MRKVRAVTKNWRPFLSYARRHGPTHWERARFIVQVGLFACLFNGDRWPAFALLGGLWIFFAGAGLVHRVRCYRKEPLPPPGDDDGLPPQGGDRYEVINGRDVFRRYPWLPR